MHKHTLKLAIAYLGANQVSPAELSSVLRQIDDTLTEFDGGPKLNPAIPIEESIHPDYLVCLEDGRRLKMLKRYLFLNFNMTPEEYREKWGLPEDYPMVCENYSKKRAGIAKDQGLGKSPSSPTPEPPKS